MTNQKSIIPDERIINRIFLIRGKKVMFDFDLAALYGVTTGNSNKSVKRNKERFPDDFMFQLTKKEFETWKEQILMFQNGISSWGGRRTLPCVFTENGVAMLSSVLKSKRAVQANIAIIRTFTKLREILLTKKELRQKIEQMERKYDEQFRAVFEAIKRILIEEEKPKQPMGFRAGN